MTRTPLHVVTGAMILTALLTCISAGQGSPTLLKGTADNEIWAGGVVAQHDGTTSFNTEIFMAGARFGRILTAPHGPGWLRGTLQWNFDVIPLFIVTKARPVHIWNWQVV